MTTSWFKIKELYGLTSDAEIMVMWCLNNGFVHSNDDFFVAGYMTMSQNCNNSLDKPDTIHVCIAAGNLKRAFEALPEMDFIRFQRQDGNVREHSYKRFRRLVWAIQERAL